ncbi:MAG: hypothetical protein AB8G11_16055 [Saprospiraceae bacterium]
MKLFRLLFLLIISTLVACSGGNPVDKILKQVAKDRVIDDTEIKKLHNKSAYKVLWTNNKVDTTKVKAYLQKIKIPNITFQLSTSNEIKPTYNIFLENSASMDGYVKGKTKFESSIYAFLSDINLSGTIADSLNLNYINSKKIPFKPEVEDFIDKLEPSTFSSRGGNRGNSDMKNILDNILTETEDNNVSVFISDCLFSLKSTNNTEELLTNQSIGIKTIFAKKLKESKDFAVLVLHLNSEFDGNFYTYKNQRIKVDDERPYYIWIMGNHHYIKTLMKELNIEKSLKGNIENYFCWAKSSTTPAYRTTMLESWGSYRPNPTNPLYGMQNPTKGKRAEQKGIFQFSIAVDLEGYGLHPDYLDNINNYSTSDDAFEVVKASKITKEQKRKRENLSDYSHIIVIQTKKIKSVDLDISLKQVFPEWINEWHWEPEKGKNEQEELQKSFGLKYLLEGVDEAYKGPKSEEKNFFTLTVNIEN